MKILVNTFKLMIIAVWMITCYYVCRTGEGFMYFEYWILCGFPFGLRKMFMLLIPRNFGRIAAQTAKQVIVQKIREAERDMIFTEYNDRKGEIVSGIVQKSDGGTVVLDLGKLEGIMLLKDQIPTEEYRVNDKVRAYVVSVEKGIKGAPQVLVSRSHPDFVRKLFEF